MAARWATAPTLGTRSAWEAHRGGEEAEDCGGGEPRQIGEETRLKVTDMSTEDIAPTRQIDLNDGKEWSQMDIFDLRNSVAYGLSLSEVAQFLCRGGTLDDVRRKAEELGLTFRLGPIQRRPAVRKGVTRRPKQRVGAGRSHGWWLLKPGFAKRGKPLKKYG